MKPFARIIRSVLMALVMLGAILAPRRLRADQLPQEALNTFPADTRQVAFTNLAVLRNSPVYPQVRQRLLDQPLRAFQEFLRPMGIDPDRDVDEVMVGWRGEVAGPSGYLGMAAGHFQPDMIQKYFDRTNLPTRTYAGNTLYAFGSGSDPEDLFFTFLEPSVAAFGRLTDLKAMLDVRQGSANALNSDSDLVNWESELEGTAPQWGILNGKSASNLAALWLAGSDNKSVDFSSLARSVRALLYRVQWDTEFSSELIVVCDTSASATGFMTMIDLLQKAAKQAGPAASSGIPPILQSIDAHRDGARVILDASGPAEALTQILGAN